MCSKKVLAYTMFKSGEVFSDRASKPDLKQIICIDEFTNIFGDFSIFGLELFEAKIRTVQDNPSSI